MSGDYATLAQSRALLGESKQLEEFLDHLFAHADSSIFDLCDYEAAELAVLLVWTLGSLFLLAIYQAWDYPLHSFTHIEGPDQHTSRLFNKVLLSIMFGVIAHCL